MNQNALKNINLEMTFPKTFEKITGSGFIRGRARIAYAGSNRNFTNISKEAFNNAMDSLALVPVVGNWLSDKKNFGGHDSSFEDIGGVLTLIDKTRPYGVVPENHNATWVDVEDSNGNVKKYVECDVVFWEERYPEPIAKIINGGINQSMEIVPTDASYNETTGDYDIHQFYYSSLCLLGRDSEDMNNNVEPCFEQSEITISQFNLDKDAFKQEFNLMVKELKESFKGGENVADEKEKVVEDLETEIEAEVVIEDEITEEVEIDVEEEITEEVEDVEVETEEEIQVETEADVIATEEPVEEEVEETVVEEEVESIFNEFEAKYNALKVEHDALESEVEELRKFKSESLLEQKQELVEEIFEKYATLLDKSEFSDLEETAIDMTIDELEKELSFRLVQKKFDFSKIVKKDSTKFNIKNDTKEVNHYGSASVYFDK